MVEEIREAWGWIGMDPHELVGTNAFGNVIVRDRVGAYWRICPEDLSCEVIAPTDEKYQALCGDPEFIEDWEMTALVVLAQKKLGLLPADQSYCLKLPAPLGGEYDVENFGLVPTAELIRFSGDLARQMRESPDGAKINIQIVE